MQFHNALVVDINGIFKADIGIKDGLIHKIGKSGNPDTQPQIDIIIGPGTEIIAGEGKIITAGGFDSHIHFICPQQIEDALHSGLTTMLGGGTGPAHGTLATTCTPLYLLESIDDQVQFDTVYVYYLCAILFSLSFHLLFLTKVPLHI